MTDHGTGHGSENGTGHGDSTHGKNAAAAAHAPVAHEPAHGTPDASHAAHDPTDVALGPIDWPAWLAGALGVAAGLLVLAAFYVAGRG